MSELTAAAATTTTTTTVDGGGYRLPDATTLQHATKLAIV